MRLLYSALWWLLMPFVLLRIWRRGRKEPGYRQHVGERLGIEDKVISFLTQLPVKAGNFSTRSRICQTFTPAAQSNRNDMTNMRIEPHQTGIALFHYPIDIGMREVAPDVRHHRHVVNDIAQRRYADDQNIQCKPVIVIGTWARILLRSKRQCHIRPGRQDHALEFILNARQRLGGLGFKAQHHHRCRIG